MRPMTYQLPSPVTAPDGSSLTHASLSQVDGTGGLPIIGRYGTLDADGAFQRATIEPFADHAFHRHWARGEFEAFRLQVRDAAADAGAADLDDVAFRPSDLAAWLDQYGLATSTWEAS